MTAPEQALAVREPAPLAIPEAAELSHMMEVVRSIQDTDFVGKNLRGKPAAILACILYGRELGIGPMESLREVHLIDGTPSLSAAAKLKRAREQGHSVRVVEINDERVTLHGRRADTGDEMKASYSLEDAQRAGLLGKHNWKAYPEDMMFARATSRLCKRLFGDVPGLLALDPDEAELTVEARIAEAVSDLPLPQDSEGGTSRDSGRTHVRRTRHG